MSDDIINQARALIGKEFASSSKMTSRSYQGLLDEIGSRVKILKRVLDANPHIDPQNDPTGLITHVTEEVDRLRARAKEFVDLKAKTKAEEDAAKAAQQEKWRQDKAKQRARAKQTQAAKAAGLPKPPVRKRKPLAAVFNDAVDSVTAPKHQKAENEIKVPVIPIPDCSICFAQPDHPSMIGTFCDNGHPFCFPCLQKLVLNTYAMRMDAHRHGYATAVRAESNRSSYESARLTCSVCRTGTLPELTMQGFRYYFDPVSSDMLSKQLTSDKLKAALTCSGCQTVSGSLLQAFNHFKLCTSFPWPCVHAECTKTVGKAIPFGIKTIDPNDLHLARTNFGNRFLAHFKRECTKSQGLCTLGCANKLLQLGQVYRHMAWHGLCNKQASTASLLSKLASTMPLAAHFMASPMLFDTPESDLANEDTAPAIGDQLDLLKQLAHQLERNASVFRVQPEEKKIAAAPVAAASPPPPPPVASDAPMPPVPPAPVPATVASLIAAGLMRPRPPPIDVEMSVNDDEKVPDERPGSPQYSPTSPRYSPLTPEYESSAGPVYRPDDGGAPSS